MVSSRTIWILAVILGFYSFYSPVAGVLAIVMLCYDKTGDFLRAKSDKSLEELHERIKSLEAETARLKTHVNWASKK